MAKYGIFVTTDEFAIAAMKTTVGSPADSDWDAQDGGRKLLFGNSKVKSLWAYADNKDAYLFDASDSISDPSSVWTDDGNVFIKVPLNSGQTGTQGSSSSNYLEGGGTDAPGSGETINSVSITVFASATAGTPTLGIRVTTDAAAETLLDTTQVVNTTNTLYFFTLTTPSGGWTYAKLQAIEIRFWKDDAGGDFVKVFYSEVIANVSDDIHIATQQENGRVAYHVFDPGTDKFTTFDEQVARIGDHANFDGIPDSPGCSLALRSDGDVVVAFTGKNGSATDTFYAIKTSSWGSVSTLVANSLNPIMVGPDGSDRVTVAFKLDDVPASLRTISISSADALGTNTAIDAGVDDATFLIAPGVIDSGDKIYFPYIDAANDVAVADWASAAAPTANLTASVSDNTVEGNGRSSIPFVVACLAVNGTDVHLLYANDADADIYHDDDVDGGGASDTELNDAVTANRLSCKFDSGGSNILYFYENTGTADVVFDTVSVSVAPSGTGILTLPSLSQAGVAAQIFTGTGANALAPVVQAGVGVMQPSGTGVLTLAAVTQAGVGEEKIIGTSVQTLASLLQSASAVQVFTGTSIQTLASLLQAGVGVMQPSGTSVQTLASLIQAAAGIQIFTGTSAQILASLIQAAVGVMHPSGVADQLLPELTQNGVGKQIFVSTGVQTLASLVQAAVGVMQPSGTSIQTLASLLQAAEGVTGETTGTSIQTLASLIQAGVGVMQPSGTSVQTLASLIQAAAAIQIFTSTSVQTLASLLQAAEGATEETTGTSIQTLASLLQAGVGKQIFTGTSIQTLASLVQAGVGVMQPSGTSIQTLASLIQSAAGVQVFTGTSIQTLASLLQSGVGIMLPKGDGAQNLAALTQAGVGVQIFVVNGIQVLGALTQAGVGVMQPSGTGIQTLASLLQAAEGITGETSGTSIQTLASLLQAGVGVMQPSGTSIQTLASLIQASVGVMQPSGTSVQTLASLIQAATGVQVFTGTSIQTLASLLQAGVGVMQPSGASVQTLAGLVQLGSGVLLETGVGSQLLSSILQSGNGVQVFSGQGIQLLGPITQVGSGLEKLIGVGIQNLPIFLQVGTGRMIPVGAGVQILANLLQLGLGTSVTPVTIVGAIYGNVITDMLSVDVIVDNISVNFETD